MKHLKANRYTYVLYTFILLLTFSSCDKDDDIKGGTDSEITEDSTIPDITPITPIGDVYVSGRNETGSSISKPIYFKNGEVVELEGVGSHSEANFIEVSGEDVHVLGWSKSIRQPVYWKNGVPQILEHPNPSSIAILGDIAIPIDIAVSGDDVHMIMQRSSSIGLDYAIHYWKNDVRTLIPSNEGKENYASGLTVNKDDVYIFGQQIFKERAEFASDGEWPIATYWKNGVSVSVTNGKRTSWVQQMVIKGDDVYVGYTEHIEGGSLSYILKNGTQILAFDNRENLQDFIVKDGIVHSVSRNSEGEVKYYRNNVATTITSAISVPKKIRMHNNDIYISGTFYQGESESVHSQILKNNVLFSDLEYDGSKENIEIYDMTIN